MSKKKVVMAMAILILALCIGIAGAVGENAREHLLPEVTGTHIDDGIFSPQSYHSALSYKRNNTVYVGSGNQMIQEQSFEDLDTRTVSLNNHYSNGYKFTLRNGRQAFLLTPFVSTINTNGIKPKVRYLWFTLKMPVGVNVTWMGVASGSNYVKDISFSRAGTGGIKDYKVDLGSYYSMPRGTQLYVTIQNDLSSNQTIYAYGGRMRQEW